MISSAIAEDNPELRAARATGLPVWARQQAIAAVADAHRSIAVAGTTGKTTTTSMIATVLEREGLEPTYLIGGDLNESGSGAKAGTGDLFLFEADESDGSFLLTDHTIGVVTNIELDHVDFYPGGAEELRAFAEFCARSGQVVICGDDPGARGAVSLAGVPAISYGTAAEADVRLTIATPGPGGARGSLLVEGRGAGGTADRRGAQPAGRRGRRGGLELVGISPSDAARALASFAGVHRRFEERGRVRGARFFDDYAHVPTELSVTLAVARARRPGRLVAVFQPHRYSRTQALWRRLGGAHGGGPRGRDRRLRGEQEPIPGVTGALVVDGVRAAAPTARWCTPRERTRSRCSPGRFVTVIS